MGQDAGSSPPPAGERTAPDEGPGSGEARPVPAPARARPVGRSGVRLVLESVLIVLSVLLAFGLNEWRLQRADRALAVSVLAGFKQEIEANLALLEEFQPQHVRLAEAVGRLGPEAVAGRTAFDVIEASRDDRGTVIMSPAEVAWQAAVSTGALRLLDYETAAVLSRIYFAQRNYVGQTSERLTDLVFDGRMFVADEAERALQVFLALLRELAAQEASLMGEYRAGLARLEALGI